MKEVKEIFNKTSNSIIFSSVLALIVGIILVVSPEMSMKTIGLIAAIYIILHGILLVALDVTASKYYVPFDGLLSGLLFIILGIVLITRPDILPVVFTLALGIWFVLSGVNMIKLSITVKNEYDQWYLLLILGILDLIAGIVVIFNPFEAALSVTVFAGLMIIVHSVITIVDMFLIKKDVKEIAKAVGEQLKASK